MPDPWWRAVANSALPAPVRAQTRTAYHRLRPFVPRPGVSAIVAKLGLGRLGDLGPWLADGCPVPPADVRKRQALYELLVTSSVQVAIETGTLLGDTTDFLSRHCRKVVTIELSPELATNARRRFAAITQVEVVEGDSGIVLADVLGRIDEPALFWLDGHYSGDGTARGEVDSPLLAELETIASWRHALASVVAIDDALAFGEDPSYPTLAQAREVALRVGWDCFTMQNNMIVMHPFPQPARA